MMLIFQWLILKKKVGTIHCSHLNISSIAEKYLTALPSYQNDKENIFLQLSIKSEYETIFLFKLD